MAALTAADLDEATKDQIRQLALEGNNTDEIADAIGVPVSKATISAFIANVTRSEEALGRLYVAMRSAAKAGSTTADIQLRFAPAMNRSEIRQICRAELASYRRELAQAQAATTRRRSRR